MVTESSIRGSNYRRTKSPLHLETPSRVKRKLIFGSEEPQPKSQIRTTIERLDRGLEEIRRKRKANAVEIDGDDMFTAIREEGIRNFSGAGNPNKARNWIKKLDDIFEKLQSPEHRRIEYAHHLLSCDALEWWECKKWIHEHPESITWDEFKQMFIDQFNIFWYDRRRELYRWEPVKILGWTGRRLRSGDTQVKVLWRNCDGEKTTWEEEKAFRKKYPVLTYADLSD